MKRIIICIMFIILSFTLFGCEKATKLPDNSSGEIDSSESIFPPKNYKISDEDQKSADLLKEIGLDDYYVSLVIYNLKKTNCGEIAKIEIDSSGNYYNIYDDNDNLFKLYVAGNKESGMMKADALLDKDGKTIFAIIY